MTNDLNGNNEDNIDDDDVYMLIVCLEFIVLISCQFI